MKRHHDVTRHATAAHVALALSAALLVSSCATAPPVRHREPARTANALVYHTGKRTDMQGIPMLDISGPPYEVGLQYGVLLRPEIRSLYADFNTLLDQLTGGGLRGFLFRLSLSGKLAEMRSALPQGFEDEEHGIADGSDIPFSDFLFFAMTPEILFDTACTSVVVRRGDQIVHVRNFDFPRPANLVWRYPVIVKVAVDGKIPYVNVGFAGLPGVYTGLNARGLAASVNTAAFTRNVQRNVIPVGFLVKEVLENCTSLEDVDSVMRHSAASHYFVEVSSRDECSAALYESLGDSITKVPMNADIQSVANAPLSQVNRFANASILSQAEYNVARENKLGVLKNIAPDESLVDFSLDVLRNHDFYSYRDFPAHQTLLQDSLKTINNFSTIQSVIIDWPENRVLFSYRSCYAGFGPFLSYDLTSGTISPWCAEDPFVKTEGFHADCEFLDSAFTIAMAHTMTLDKEGWERVEEVISEDTDMNPFLKADWTFSASLALHRFGDARKAAEWMDQAFPDYYLGPFDLGLAAFEKRDRVTARVSFLDSLSRPINSPATRLLAAAYASVSSRHLGDGETEKYLRTQARLILAGFWIPQDFDTRLRSYIHDAEVADLIHDIAREPASR
jgi:predicted choloylglycine hydrolase